MNIYVMVWLSIHYEFIITPKIKHGNNSMPALL